MDYKKYILILWVLVLGAILISCEEGQKKKEFSVENAKTLDYSQMPENFIIKIEDKQPYLVKKGDESFYFGINMKKDLTGDYGTIDLKWNEIERENYDVLRLASRTPYLISYNGGDYLYLSEKQKILQHSSLTFFDFTEDYLSVDNDMTGFVEEPTDPDNMLMAVMVLSIGRGHAEILCYPGEGGRPIRKETDDPYYYYAKEYEEDTLTLIQDIEVEVLETRDDKAGVKEVLKSGTKFKKFRTDNYKNVDLLMEDGRIARFEALKMFSEPSPILMVNGVNERDLFEELE
ncbi:MAG: hypothetical protein GX666_04270 [Tissierellia bacterium]|nr:hypothetical protein [Tissierellia bacterium]